MFSDATSGTTTYPAGRQLYAPAPAADGTVVLDFNRTINLPCAYTDFTTCPVPPPQNRLPFAIEAGEQTRRRQSRPRRSDTRISRSSPVTTHAACWEHVVEGAHEPAGPPRQAGAPAQECGKAGVNIGAVQVFSSQVPGTATIELVVRTPEDWGEAEVVALAAPRRR